jgi:hypothetical protein
MEASDRKMFAPVFRGETRSLETQVCAVLGGYEAGTTAAGLADELLRRGYAIGVKASVARRIEGLLEDLERAARVERIPDGRYRVVKTTRSEGLKF